MSSAKFCLQFDKVQGNGDVRKQSTSHIGNSQRTQWRLLAELGSGYVLLLLLWPGDLF